MPAIFQCSVCVYDLLIFAAVMLSDQDANVLDMKTVSFKTIEGCIYCPAGQCDCDVSYQLQLLG